MRKIIIGIVIGAIISGTTVYAASILSSSVVYDNSTSNGSSKTVQGALDELYNKVKYGDATREDILKGKTALVQGQEVVGSFVPFNGNFKVITSKDLITPTNSDTYTFESNYDYILIIDTIFFMSAFEPTNEPNSTNLSLKKIFSSSYTINSSLNYYMWTRIYSIDNVKIGQTVTIPRTNCNKYVILGI